MIALPHNRFARLGLAAAIVAGLGALGAPAIAAPRHTSHHAVQSQDFSSARYHRHHRGYYGPGIAAGVAGAVVGAATAPLWALGSAPYPYYERGYYAGRGECMIDEGYGRTTPCDGAS
jgi:hypothetical protein